MRNSSMLVGAVLACSVAAAVGCSSTGPHNEAAGGLWAANQAVDTTPEFATSQLQASGSPSPAVRLVTKSDCATGLALDAVGNMWESDCDSQLLVKYSVTAREHGGAATPTAEITSAALTSAEQMSFDSHGNLWVTICGDTRGILEYSAAQLTAAGTQTPQATITSSGITGFCPYDIAFDGSGNMWVADYNHPQVVEFSAGQLTGTGDNVPAKTISSPVLVATAAVVFDASGNLWVANHSGQSVVEYTAAQVSAGGSVTPTATITLPGTPIKADPVGLAFDAGGSLWVSDQVNQVVYSLSSNQLVTGSPTPSITLGSTLKSFYPEQLLFDPYGIPNNVRAQ